MKKQVLAVFLCLTTIFLFVQPAVFAAPPYEKAVCTNEGSIDFYRTQHDTGTKSNVNCGPTSLHMAMTYSAGTKTGVPTPQEIRNWRQTGLDGSDYYWNIDIKEALIHYGFNDAVYPDISAYYPSTSKDLTPLISEIKDYLCKEYVLIFCLKTGKVSSSSNPSSTRFDRHYSNDFGHFVVVKGYLENVNGKDWAIVNDPWVMNGHYYSGSYPSGDPMGKDRYWNMKELVSTLVDWSNDEVNKGGIWTYAAIPTKAPCTDPVPVADFTATPTSGDAPLKVTFTDASTSATSWKWDFGDGNTGSGANPTHTYTTGGNFKVVLTASTCAGSDTAQTTIAVNGPIEVIVDNSASNTYKTGTWNTSSASGAYGQNSIYNDTGETFRWLPSLSEAGRYEVYAWWTYHANRTNNVPYLITTSTGVETVTVNQKDNALAGKWNLLGTYDFSAGEASIEISGHTGQACADAIRFLQQGGGPVETKPTITSPSTASGVKGSSFKYTITATGTAPIIFSLSSLPSGLSFDGNNTISGTMPAAGTYTIGITASNNVGTDRMDLSLTSTDSTPPDENSCVGNCGGKAPGGCWCDSGCSSYGDCCADKVSVCGN